MPSPKRIQEIKYWLRGARAVLPKIPSVEVTDWRILGEPKISVQEIRIELTNTVGERATVIIDRTKPALGT
jgi:hypothetical protein